MYESEPPQPLKPDWVASLETCPAIDGVGSKMPDANLVRWKAVYESFKDWHETGNAPEEIIDRQFSWMDPVQQNITASLFASACLLLPRQEGETVDWDPPTHQVDDTELNATLTARVQAAVTGPNGRELIKLKTGRFGTSEAELAVLLAGMPDEGGVLTEMMLANGDLRVLRRDPDEVSNEVDRLWEVWRAHQGRDSKPRSPGLHCYSCPRAARCGQYPVVGGGKTTSRTRTVVVSKTWLEKLNVCERQVAWKRLYGIPDDTGEEEDTTARSRGSAFHELIAAALLAEDPAAVFADAMKSAEASEQQQLRWLFDRHQRLTAVDPYPPDYKRTEYEMGITLLVPGIEMDTRDNIREAEVAVVMIARVDGAGRETDGTPVVVEHRTGESATETSFETDLYALSTAWAVTDNRAAVHVHRLGLQDGPVCERTFYDEEALTEAADRLRAAAERLAAWHPANATIPPFTVGGWCTWCPIRERCERHR
jgi:hypothetical protein